MLKSLLLALTMYSKIPLPRVDFEEQNMNLVFCFFPLVGLIEAILVYAVGSFLCEKSPILYFAVMCVLPIIINGGIHFDGYLDTVDALSSWGEKEDKLKILKDPNVGAFALVYGLCYFIFSFGLWSEINKRLLPFVCMGYIISRCLSGISVVTFKNAKKDGLVANFSKGANKNITVVVNVLLLMLVYGFALFLNITLGLGLVLSSVMVFIYHYFNCKNNFGGITGDLAGYFLQLCELAILMTVVVINLFNLYI